MVRTVEAELGDFVGLDSMDIAKGFRSEETTIVLVQCRVLKVVILLFVAPIGHVWKFLELDSSRGTRWFEDLVKEAETGALQAEIKASRLRNKSLPNGLFEVGDVEKLLHPRNYLNSWYRTLELPPEAVPKALQRARDWMSQLNSEALLRVSDEQSASPSWGLVDTRLLNKPDNDLFNDLWSQQKLAEWHRNGGIAKRLLHQIENLEKTGQHTLKIDDEFMASVALPKIDRKHLRNAKVASRWVVLAQGIGAGADVVNLENLDYLFACYSRLANLLDWPALYPSARANLLDESALAQQLPISSGLPVDPLAELRTFVKRQEHRFPVLMAESLVQ